MATSIIKNPYEDVTFTPNMSVLDSWYGGLTTRIADGLCLFQYGGALKTAPAAWTDVTIGTLNGVKAVGNAYAPAVSNSGDARTLQINESTVVIRTLGVSSSEKTFRGFIVFPCVNS